MDTTGTTAAFLLLDLARNKEKQEILYREICEHAEGEITEPGLAKMKYLKAWDTTIGGYEVPKGVNVR